MKKSIEMQSRSLVKRAFGVAAMVGLVGLTGVAQATPITGSPVKLSFPGPNGLFPDGSSNATISYNNLSGANTVNSGVAAGMFGGVATAVEGGFDVNRLYRNEGDVLAYCVDILNYLLKPQNTYHVNDLEQTTVVTEDGVRRDFGQALIFLGAANEVASREEFGGLKEGDKNWLNPGSAWLSAAFQIGLWESLYEGRSSQVQVVTEAPANQLVLAAPAGLSITDGWFTATLWGDPQSSSNANISSFLSESFALMGSVDALDAEQVKWLRIDGGQDLLVDPVDVPAPGPLALMLGGLALLLRRKP